MGKRETVIVQGALARAQVREKAADGQAHGLQILTFEALACRLAGGFATSIDDQTLRKAILAALPETPLGELDGIKDLPGLVSAASDTLRKAWRSGLDLASETARHPRIAALADLEAAVLDRLPASKLRPADIVAKAMPRLDLSETLFGPIRIVDIAGLSPAWRPLLHALAARVPTVWEAGPRSIPEWLDTKVIAVTRSQAERPDVSCVTAANARHEAIEAMRWARHLVASKAAKPEEIAIAAAIPSDYDEEFLCLRADANLDLHFVHGVPVTSTRDGQAAAALADILLRGASQSRMRRLSALARGGGLFAALPDGWTRVLPLDAPLSSNTAWRRFLEGLAPDAWPDGKDHRDDLRAILALVERGPAAAGEAGERILGGRARATWRMALENGPAASLDATLEALRQPDATAASRSICWMSAGELAASPRRHARLLGLNSGRWPRGRSEDRLLADHVIDNRLLDPLPPSDADRRDFETILATTATAVVLSRSRRDGEGRLLGRSPLLHGKPKEVALRRNAAPAHAFSETDRLAARPAEFAGCEQAVRGTGAWNDWRRPELTAHDGLVSPNHPAIAAVLQRVQSASSLRALLRNPIGFVWRYGLHFKEPASGVDPLVLEPPAFGDLVHRVLDGALTALDAQGGLAAATLESIADAVDAAAAKVATTWAATQPLPPALIWNRTLAEAKELSRRGMDLGEALAPGTRSFCEVPFGGSESRSDGVAPWDADAEVAIPGTGFRIAGRIDRLDLPPGGAAALVRDYKTGKTPDDPVVLGGGKELQRCLYAYAVKALLGEGVDVSASLFYLRDGVDMRLDDPPSVMERLAGHLRLARESLLSGAAVAGIDAADKYDDLAFALPANATAVYVKRKGAAAAARLGEAAQVWEVE
jgi:hypothetical protein